MVCSVINVKTCYIERSIEMNNRVYERWCVWSVMLKRTLSKKVLKWIIVSMNNGIFVYFCPFLMLIKIIKVAQLKK